MWNQYVEDMNTDIKEGYNKFSGLLYDVVAVIWKNMNSDSVPVGFSLEICSFPVSELIGLCL